MVQSANIFGSFLNEVSKGSSSSAAGTVNSFSDALNAALKSSDSLTRGRTGSQATPDMIPTILRSIIDNHASNIVAIAETTGLKYDAIAAALQSAQTTGLLRAVSDADDTVTYEVTPLGQKML